jgi:hypothetical protein
MFLHEIRVWAETLSKHVLANTLKCSLLITEKIKVANYVKPVKSTAAAGLPIWQLITFSSLLRRSTQVALKENRLALGRI